MCGSATGGEYILYAHQEPGKSTLYDKTDKDDVVAAGKAVGP